MNIVVTVPAGCGEILQGNMDKRSLIVACPVNLYVTARVVDGVFDELAVPEKSRRAVAATLRYLGEKSFPMRSVFRLPCRREKACRRAAPT